jgi:hypothetical protein
VRDCSSLRSARQVLEGVEAGNVDSFTEFLAPTPEVGGHESACVRRPVLSIGGSVRPRDVANRGDLMNRASVGWPACPACRPLTILPDVWYVAGTEGDDTRMSLCQRGALHLTPVAATSTHMLSDGSGLCDKAAVNVKPVIAPGLMKSPACSSVFLVEPFR